MTEPATAVREGATVHHLDEHRPAPGSAPDTPVSLVKDAPAAPPDPASESTRGVRWRRAARAGVAALRHERTRSTGRLLVRHGSYALAGGGILARRAWDGRSAARYERMIRTAEAAGQHEAAAEWEERGRAFRAARHQRRMDLLTAPQRLAKSAAVGVGAGAGGLLLLGGAMALADHNPALIVGPFMVTIEAIRWIVVIAMVVWGVGKFLAPWLLLLALWNVGRRRQAAPNWALPARERGGGDPITPSIVVQALRNLGISALRNAIKDMEDAGAGMLGPITLAGCGVEVDVMLPSGSSTEEVMARRRKLAENLGRHEHEVHISVAPAARTVRLWIADSGALDEPIGPSPLVTDTEPTANYKTGRAPWGVNLRGDAVLISLYQMMLLITGLSNQGKTAALRALALWLAFDTSVEFRIGDLKGYGDWAMFDGLATVLIQGPTDDHVADVTEMVEDAFEEMQRRLLAPAGTKFHPIVLIVDEAQVAYGCSAVDDRKRPYGGAKNTSRYFQAIKAIHDQGRVVDVTIWEGTQDPTNENLPKRSREGNHIRASLVVGTESQSRMALKESVVDAGAAPHKLRQGLDKGQVVASGDGLELPPDQPFMNVRTHYIDTDEAGQVAERAKARRAGVTTLHTAQTGEERDKLADIADAVGDAPRVLTQDVLKRLAALAVDAYGTWSFIDLKSALEGTGAEPYKSDGRMVIARDRIQRALADRPETDSASAHR